MGQIRLNENQKKAVEYNEGDLLIIAGAGTGKTAVLTQRIINIIKKGYAKPSEILALTFTEKAAQEMQERVDLEMEYGYEEPVISTFHSFCDKILREDGYNIGLDSGYVLMSTTQEYIFLRKHMYDLPLKTLRPKGNPKNFLHDLISHFSRLQDEDVSPQNYLEYASSLSKATPVEEEEAVKVGELAETYKKFAELKLENSKLDFGDLIILTLRLFRERKNVLEKYRKRFKYVLVDEFQDTNFTQNVLVNTLVLGIGESNCRPLLTVVGDDDQAIYKFRGAAISNILQFKKTYPKSQEIVLTENYRSRQEILDASYTLIKHNNPNRLEVTEKIDKRLLAKGIFKPEEKPVNLLVANNEFDEAERVVEEILKLTGHEENILDTSMSESFDEKGQSSLIPEDSNYYDFSDIAIFVRANSHAETIVQALRNKGVPYKIGGSRGLYFREEVRNLIAFLNVLVDYSDEVSMYRLISMPIWGLSPREYIDINSKARKSNITLYEEIERMFGIKIGEVKDEDSPKDVEEDIRKKLSPKAIAGIGSLLMILDSSVKKIKDNRSVLEVLYDFIMQSSYLSSFLDQSNSEGAFAVSNIHKFFEIVKQYEKDNPDSNIYEYVDYLKYSIEIGESPLVDQTDMSEFNGVNIMTVHASKGLEFPVVFLVNLVAQRFPAQGRSESIPIPEGLIKETVVGDFTEKESNLQEERRLFYVGATRAMEKLFLSAAYFYGDGKRKKKPSIFLNEILDRDVEEEFKNSAEKNLANFDFDLGTMDDFPEILQKDGVKNLVGRFSYSQLNTYEDCPRKYEYAYVLKVPQKPNATLSFGITIHNTLKDFYSLLLQYQSGFEGIYSLPSKEDLLELYKKNWVGVGYESSMHEKARKEEGIGILENFYERVFSEDDRPLRLEEGFNVHIGGTIFAGKIDRIDLARKDEEVTEVCIVDYKTGKEKSEKDVKNDLQLPLYALFAEEKLGYHVVGAKYIYIETGKILPVDVSQEKREIAKEKILRGIECIESGNFDPTPGFHCRFCDYNSVCRYADL